jgi:hypothetical protein
MRSTSASGNKKVVSDYLELEANTRLWSRALSRKHLSIQEGLHEAVLKLINEENKVDANKFFLQDWTSAKGKLPRRYINEP